MSRGLANHVFHALQRVDRRLCAGCGGLFTPDMAVFKRRRKVGHSMWLGAGQATACRKLSRMALSSLIVLSSSSALLRLKEGMTIADIGAGTGQLSSALASEVGTSGRIFATDVDRGRVEVLGDKFRREKLTNVVVVEGGTSDTRLPPACCDAIVLRRVYHHLTDTAGINASLLRSLQPDGVLAIIDFPPPFFLSRGEFGVPAKVVIGEVTRGGFELLRLINDWPGRGPLGSYCVLFRKPL